MRPLVRIRTLRCVATGAAALALAGCGSGLAAAGANQKASGTRTTRADATCARRSAFELSLVRDRGGQPTPVAAATWFARHGGIRGIPRSGWGLTKDDRGDATLTSRQTVLHAVKGSDGTWQVDSGYTCTSS
jgi:hypothetical protein